QAGRGRSWDMGNNDLQPERSTNYELGFSWNTAEQVNFGVMAYYTRYKDKIDKQTICTSPPGAPNCHYNGETRESINQYVNLDAATLRGVEVTFGMPLGPTTLNANYTYSDSEITSGINEGQPLN